MPSVFSFRALVLVGGMGLLCQSCEVQPALRGPFIKAAYSDPTTEIVDHTLFDLVGTTPFYEDFWVYQRRVNEYEPDDLAGKQAFMRRYLRRRATNLQPVILVAWPRLSSATLSLEKRSAFLAALSRAATDKPAKDTLMGDELYRRLLRTMHGASLRVEEMRNTGLYTLIAPSRAIQPEPGFSWPAHDWQSSSANRMPVGQFAVSAAVVNPAGTRACLVLERLAGNSGRAEFIFVERRSGRWVLIHRFDYWTS